MYRVEPFLGNGSVNTFPRQRVRMQQKRYCSKRCFRLCPCKKVIRRTIEARIIQLEGSPEADE
jgi:hypothetical protein